MLTEAQQVLAEAMPEKELQGNIIQLARPLGYLVHAERPALHKDGSWATPIQGDAGFKDLVLVRKQSISHGHIVRGRVIWAELKTMKGHLTEGQRIWDEFLKEAEQESYIWRPSDWFSGAILQVLAQGNAATFCEKVK